MGLLTREYIKKTFYPIDWQDRKERVPNDYGPPERQSNPDYVPMTAEEEAEYWDRLQEMQDDTIPW